MLEQRLFAAITIDPLLQLFPIIIIIFWTINYRSNFDYSILPFNNTHTQFIRKYTRFVSLRI